MKEIVLDLKDKFKACEDEIEKVIVGQRDLLKLINLAIISKGHTLITGAPGLAKTLLVKAISKVLGLNSSRIQFTPDLLPSDIVGMEIIDFNPENQKKEFRYLFGPVFTNILLADEINRATPRTQSALLEAMQEKRVTLGGNNYKLDEPFIVFATRNPIDNEGVYPLPEAQLDRFLMELIVDYPSYEEELLIASKNYGDELDSLNILISKDDLIKYQNLVHQVPVPDNVMKYAVNLTRKTRPSDTSSPAYVKEYLEWGAGPRATYHLVHCAKAYALLYGEGVLRNEDINFVFPHVLRHRVIPTALFNRSGKEINELIRKITTD
jgi:MoxR-like ATPase